MQTRISDSEGAGNDQVLSQFIHLSIQEFMAVTGQVRRAVKDLSKSGQFNMALLFLYGLAFNTGNETIMALSMAISGSVDQWEEMKKVLCDSISVSIIYLLHLFPFLPQG